LPEERRRHKRINFHSTAQLSVSGESHSVRVEDLSLKGALIERPPIPGLSPGAGCRLVLTLGAEQSIELQGVVAHLDARRIGMLCRVIDIDSATHLRRLVELNLGASHLLDRELSALLEEATGGASYAEDHLPRP